MKTIRLESLLFTAFVIALALLLSHKPVHAAENSFMCDYRSTQHDQCRAGCGLDLNCLDRCDQRYKNCKDVWCSGLGSGGGGSQCTKENKEWWERLRDGAQRCLTGHNQCWQMPLDKWPPCVNLGSNWTIGIPIDGKITICYKCKGFTLSIGTGKE